MKRISRLSICAFLAVLLAACAAMPNEVYQRDQTLTEYGAAIRWSEFEQAIEFVDPQLRGQQPLSDLERERFKQIQVTGYDVKNKAVGADGGIDQLVEIRLISKNTQRERTIHDQQHWRWDLASKRYWLTTGLPDFSAQ
jgi:hypothetical protein